MQNPCGSHFVEIR